MECVWELSSRIVPGRGYGPENVPVVRCATHGWEAIGGAPITSSSSCPLGRIEEATEQALAKIAAAAEGKTAP